MPTRSSFMTVTAHITQLELSRSRFYELQAEGFFLGQVIGLVGDPGEIVVFDRGEVCLRPLLERIQRGFAQQDQTHPVGAVLGVVKV